MLIMQWLTPGDPCRAALKAEKLASRPLPIVQVGARNDSLSDVVRKMSYQELTFYRKAGGHLRGWLRLVYDFTADNNRRFPVPLERDDVRSVAYSVATWVWSRGYDHSTKKQQCRQIKQAESRRTKNRERDRAIIQAVSEGRSLRDVGLEYGLDHKAVHWIVRRGCYMSLSGGGGEFAYQGGWLFSSPGLSPKKRKRESVYPDQVRARERTAHTPAPE